MSILEDRWIEIEKNHFVHEETKASFRRSAEKGFRPAFVQSLDSLRDQVKRDDDLTLEEKRQMTGFTGTMEDITIPADHMPDGIPTTIYKPEVVPDNPVIIVYFRGGGLVVGTKRACQAPAMTFAKHTGAIVVFPEYRNLPNTEDRFAPFSDCEAAARWVLDNKTAVGGTVDSPIGLGGDSAGGLLCCTVNYAFPRQFAFQILYYPVGDLDTKGQKSFEEFWTFPGFSGRDMAKLVEWGQLLEEPSQANNPRVNPSAPRVDPPLSDSPPTLIFIGNLDPLRDGAIAYAAKLRDAGVPTEEHLFDGAAHGFTFRVQVYKTLAEKAFKITGEFVKKFKPSQPKL